MAAIMSDQVISYFSDSLSPVYFKKIQNYVYDRLGIHLADNKRVMVESRLRKRLKELQIFTFKEYCSYLFSPEGQVMEHDSLIDVITTNKTDFFREPQHFTYLADTVLPEFIQKYGYQKKMRLWSAACSNGSEPYTLAMVMEEAKKANQLWCGDYTILATDISLEILEKAKMAVYPEEDIIPVPMEIRSRYLMRSRNSQSKLVRVNPLIRSKVFFQRLNLMDQFATSEKMDIIFCRNVLIYFDKKNHDHVVHKLLKALNQGGYLMMGHSETLNVTEFPIEACAPSVYRKL